MRYNRMVSFLLVLCAPVGLLLMWLRRCTWDRVTKSTISALVAVLVLCFLSVRFQAPQWEPGGVELIGNGTQIKVYGPPIPSDLAKAVSVQPSSIVVVIDDTAPTPVPIYVYCNTGGRQYHSAECEYVYPHTARVTLLDALNGGYSKCGKCNAPFEYEINN
ncbi:MAG: hypothetical protein E7335_00935 [Clostridiales bacterium]|nr:hypothetical protein [Clostridiales bacterium]